MGAVCTNPPARFQRRGRTQGGPRQDQSPALASCGSLPGLTASLPFLEPVAMFPRLWGPPASLLLPHCPDPLHNSGSRAHTHAPPTLVMGKLRHRGRSEPQRHASPHPKLLQIHPAHSAFFPNPEDEPRPLLRGPTFLSGRGRSRPHQPRWGLLFGPQTSTSTGASSQEGRAWGITAPTGGVGRAASWPWAPGGDTERALGQQRVPVAPAPSLTPAQAFLAGDWKFPMLP